MALALFSLLTSPFLFLINIAPILHAFLASLLFVEREARGRTMSKRKWTSTIDQPKATRAVEPRAFSQYTALNKRMQEIRVVTLHAGQDDHSVVCTIEDTLLCLAGPFTALSYCWGSAEDLKEITLNGEVVTVRENLWHFLESLRQVKAPIRIWVDYICINQQDVSERGHQVQLMADIYRSASAVYAWLGAGDRSTNVAIEFVNKLRIAPPDWRKSPEARKMRRAGRVGFHSLAGRIFWSRLWIIQEVVLAKQLYVVVGRRMVDWNWITVAFKKVTFNGLNSRYDEDIDSVHKEVFYHIRALREAQARGSHPEISSLLTSFRECQCQDPKDRVYSMLGLLDPRTSSQILVDYNHTLIELFVLNSKWLLPVLKDAWLAMQYPALEIFDSSIFETVARTCGKNGRSIEVSRWKRDQALRRRSDLSLVLDARIWTIRHIFQTFAVKKAIDCDWEPLTIYNRSQDFAAYMTGVRFESSAGSRLPPGYVRNIPNVILSRLRPEPGDILLHLQPYYCIARQVQGSLQVLDIAARVDKPASETLRNVSVHDWSSAPVPDIKLRLEQSPSMLDYYSPRQRAPVGKELHWPVRVNGSALAEGIRLFDDGDRTYRGYHEHIFRVSVTLPWDPTIFILKSGDGASEPTEAQYDELSRQMRLPADMRPDSLYIERTWHEWDSFRYDQGSKYHECIPRFQTDPLMTPEVAAVPGIAEATKRYESWLDKDIQRMRQPDLSQQNGFDFNSGENFNLDFSTLDNTDVLENFDFDSFLNTTIDDAFNFDSGMLDGDFGIDAGKA